MTEDVKINLNLGKKVSCDLPDALAKECDFCDCDTKICVAKLHGGHCRFKKVGLGK